MIQRHSSRAHHQRISLPTHTRYGLTAGQSTANWAAWGPCLVRRHLVYTYQIKSKWSGNIGLRTLDKPPRSHGEMCCARRWRQSPHELYKLLDILSTSGMTKSPTCTNVSRFGILNIMLRQWLSEKEVTHMSLRQHFCNTQTMQAKRVYP